MEESSHGAIFGHGDRGVDQGKAVPAQRTLVPPGGAGETLTAVPSHPSINRNLKHNIVYSRATFSDGWRMNSYRWWVTGIGRYVVGTTGRSFTWGAEPSNPGRIAAESCLGIALYIHV